MQELLPRLRYFWATWSMDAMAHSLAIGAAMQGAITGQGDQRWAVRRFHVGRRDAVRVLLVGRQSFFKSGGG